MIVEGQEQSSHHRVSSNRSRFPGSVGNGSYQGTASRCRDLPCSTVPVTGGPLFRTIFGLLENVLGRIAAEHQLLQYPLVSLVHLVNLSVLIRLLCERNKRALHFDLFFAAGALEHHDVLLAFHGVTDDILSGWRQGRSHPNRRIKGDVPDGTINHLVWLRLERSTPAPAGTAAPQIP